MRGPGSHSYPLPILNTITRQFVPLRPCRSGKAHPPGPSRVASGCLATAPRTRRGSAHSPSTGGKPSPQEGQHLPRGHTATQLGSLVASGGSGRDRVCTIIPQGAHTHSRPFPARPGRLPSSSTSPLPCAGAGWPSRRGPRSPPARAWVARSAGSRRPERGRTRGRRRAPSGGRRGRKRERWSPAPPPPGGGDSGRGPPPRMKRRPGLAPASPFPQKGSTFGVKPNFCKINEIDRDTRSIKRERGALALGTRREKPGEAAPSGSGGYCRGGARFRSDHPLRGAAAGPPGGAGVEKDSPRPHPHPGPGPAG